MKLTTTVLLIFSIQQFFSQGINFDTEKYKSLPGYEPAINQGFANMTLPSKISYRSYCPPIQSQGQVSTCVGWATSYALLSTQQNILMGETNYYRKQIRVMDPHFVYALIRDFSDTWCQNGTIMSDAMDVLLDYGSKPQFTPPWLTCNATTEFSPFSMAIASMYSIKDYYTLQDTSNLVSTLKFALNDKKPVAIGMNVTKSFANGTAIIYGKWSPTASEQVEGGHAMCIIGYDDTKYGGSFEVMNSYGSDFGDNGFVWITYKDMKKFMQEAYLLELNTDVYGFRNESCSYGDCYNSYSRFTYNNGEVYEGELKEGYRNGWGTLLSPDNSFYIGSFSNGYKHGWGILYLPSTGYYYETYHNYGILQSSQYYQGFSGSEEEENLENLIETLQNYTPGKVIEIDSDSYQEFVDGNKPEEEPIQILQSTEQIKTTTDQIPSSMNNSSDTIEKSKNRKKKKKKI